MKRRFAGFPKYLTLFASSLGWASAHAQQPLASQRYLLHEGDSISIAYTYSGEFNETVAIQPDGYITLRVGKPVQIAGKTLDQATALIQEQATDRLLNPEVVLNLTDFQHPYFVVAGEAFAPLKYEMKEHLTVLQGLMLAGGIKPTGKEKQVVLIHDLGKPDQEIKLLDLKHVEKQAIFAHDAQMSSGDIIFIPRNKLTKAIQVMSLINSPAGYANAVLYNTR